MIRGSYTVAVVDKRERDQFRSLKGAGSSVIANFGVQWELDARWAQKCAQCKQQLRIKSGISFKLHGF